MEHPAKIERPAYTLAQIGEYFGGKSARWVYNLVHRHGLKVTLIAGSKVVLAADLEAFIAKARELQAA